PRTSGVNRFLKNGAVLPGDGKGGTHTGNGETGTDDRYAEAAGIRFSRGVTGDAGHGGCAWLEHAAGLRLTAYGGIAIAKGSLVSDDGSGGRGASKHHIRRAAHARTGAL